jgi:hypothetical protein
LTLIRANAEAPPGYVKPAEAPEKNPPKYEYGYNIQDGKGASHGKLEARDGIYALGRYYVQNADSTHSVQYYADDWGYHPFIEYSNVGPHSKTRTQLLLGVEAVKALASNKVLIICTPLAISSDIANLRSVSSSHRILHLPSNKSPTPSTARVQQEMRQGGR